MIGTPGHEGLFIYNVSAEQCVPEDHSLRRIRPIIDTRNIRKLARPADSGQSCHPNSSAQTAGRTIAGWQPWIKTPESETPFLSLALTCPSG